MSLILLPLQWCLNGVYIINRLEWQSYPLTVQVQAAGGEPGFFPPVENFPSCRKGWAETSFWHVCFLFAGTFYLYIQTYNSPSLTAWSDAGVGRWGRGLPVDSIDCVNWPFLTRKTFSVSGPLSLKKISAQTNWLQVNLLSLGGGWDLQYIPKVSSGKWV